MKNASWSSARTSLERRQELLVLEKRLLQKEENIDRKVDVLDKRERELGEKDGRLTAKINNIGLKEKELLASLEEEKQAMAVLEKVKKMRKKKQQGEFISYMDKYSAQTYEDQVFSDQFYM